MGPNSTAAGQLPFVEPAQEDQIGHGPACPRAGPGWRGAGARAGAAAPIRVRHQDREQGRVGRSRHRPGDLRRLLQLGHELARGRARPRLAQSSPLVAPFVGRQPLGESQMGREQVRQGVGAGRRSSVNGRAAAATASSRGRAPAAWPAPPTVPPGQSAHGPRKPSRPPARRGPRSIPRSRARTGGGTRPWSGRPSQRVLQRGQQRRPVLRHRPPGARSAAGSFPAATGRAARRRCRRPGYPSAAVRPRPGARAPGWA